MLYWAAVFFVIAFALPYAVLDFAWGPMERWPHAGFPLWMVLGMALLAHHSLKSLQLPTRSKVILRTTAAVTGALLSMVILRTDMLRSLGIPWPMQRQPQASRLWQQFFKSDPSSDMQGWREGAKLLGDVVTGVKNQGGEDWFLLANDWRIGVPLDYYLPACLPVLQGAQMPRVQVIQRVERDNPLSLGPRYDTMQGGQFPVRGRNAVYVTDDPRRLRPPAEVRNAFARTELLSLVRVMHGGHEVRTLKIFACHGYKPPDL